MSAPDERESCWGCCLQRPDGEGVNLVDKPTTGKRRRVCQQCRRSGGIRIPSDRVLHGSIQAPHDGSTKGVEEYFPSSRQHGKGGPWRSHENGARYYVANNTDQERIKGPRRGVALVIFATEEERQRCIPVIRGFEPLPAEEKELWLEFKYDMFLAAS